MYESLHHRPARTGFTLVELLSTIAILAILATAGLFFTVSYVSWARSVSDQRTLLILNDALTRYKTQGGSLAALTSGAPIGDVLTRLHSPITWGNLTHQVMQGAVTYPASSLSASGNGSSYYFTRYNTFTQIGTTSGGGGGASYPYGLGVGYMANGSDSGGYDVYFQTIGTATVACKDNTGAITYVDSTDGGVETVLPVAASYKFLACVDDGNQTAAGTIVTFAADGNGHQNYCSGGGNITALDVSGLTSLTDLEPDGNLLTSINVSNNTALTYLDVSSNSLTALDVSSNTALSFLLCGFNSLSSLTGVSGLTSLSYLACSSNALTSINTSGCTTLQTIVCQDNQLTSLNSSGCTLLSQLYCFDNSIVTLNITGDHDLPTRCTNGSTTFYTDPGVTVIGP